MRLRAACLTVALLLSGGAAADEVVLRNGDRISGEIASKSADVVVVRTDYAGEVSIQWREIATLSTTRVVEVLIRGEAEPVRGTLQPLYGGGALLIDAQGKARRVTLAQIAYLNPEAHHIEGRTAYTGRGTLAANYARGNVDSERFYGEAEFNARAKRYRYALNGRSERRTDPLLGTLTSWLTAANYDRFLREKDFVYARASLEHDQAKSIEQRGTVGVGYGVQVFDSERLRLSLRAGLDYVAVDRIAAESDRYPAAGWGVRLDYAPWGPNIELFHEQEGFWNLENTDVVTLRSKTGIRLPLVAKLSATAQVNVDWERSPPPPRGSTDKVLLLGVDYTW